MAIPPRFKKQLEDGLRAHEMIVQIGRDPTIRAALVELAYDSNLRQELKRDPETYMRKHGITLPKGAKVVVTETRAAFDIHIAVTIGDTTYSAGYSSEDGFYAKKEKA